MSQLYASHCTVLALNGAEFKKHPAVIILYKSPKMSQSHPCYVLIVECMDFSNLNMSGP